MHQLNACCTRAFVSGVQKLMICSMPLWVIHDRQWPASRLHAHLLDLPRCSVTSARGGPWFHDSKLVHVIVLYGHAEEVRSIFHQRWRNVLSGKSKVHASSHRMENLGKGYAVKRVQGVHVRQSAGFPACRTLADGELELRRVSSPWRCSYRGWP